MFSFIYVLFTYGLHPHLREDPRVGHYGLLIFKKTVFVTDTTNFDSKKKNVFTRKEDQGKE